MARILFTNIRIFDGTGAPTFPGEVLVEGNRVAAVAAPKPLERGGAEIVDGGGATIMPGMVEAHAHLSWPSAVDRIINAMKLEPEEHLLHHRAQCAHHARSRLHQRLFGGLARHAIRESRCATRSTAAGCPARASRRRRSSARRRRASACPNRHDGGHARGPEAMRRYIRSCAELGLDSVKLLLSGDDNFTPQRLAGHHLFRGRGRRRGRGGARAKSLARLPRAGRGGGEARPAPRFPRALPLQLCRRGGARQARGQEGRDLRRARRSVSPTRRSMSGRAWACRRRGSSAARKSWRCRPASCPSCAGAACACCRAAITAFRTTRSAATRATSNCSCACSATRPPRR